MQHYSHLFSCLYDEPEEVGNLGRGAHCSVFRSIQWFDIGGDRLPEGRIHDFAIIWDEDHDTRVIKVVERLHLAGLLWPVVFVGERKGMLFLLFDQMAGPLIDRHSDTQALIVRTVEGLRIDGDCWGCETGWFMRARVPEEGSLTSPVGIIHDIDAKVVAYLHGIDALWSLGDKDW
jgi:hypothetical protein